VAASNYTIEFAADSVISERVIFPSGPAESQGMEDARFVRFTHDDGTQLYYAIYTAFDGYQILPQLIETSDFRTFQIVTLNGGAAPTRAGILRIIDGRYAALSRQTTKQLRSLGRRPVLAGRTESGRSDLGSCSSATAARRSRPKRLATHPCRPAPLRPGCLLSTPRIRGGSSVTSMSRSGSHRG
jgi:hypothetical protein